MKDRTWLTFPFQSWVSLFKKDVIHYNDKQNVNTYIFPAYSFEGFEETVTFFSK